jgi:hypothetical protein
MTNKDEPIHAEQPAIFKVWNKMSFCAIDAERAKKRQNGEQIIDEASPCRGVYRKMTDIIEDAYYVYKSSQELRKQQNSPTPVSERVIFPTSQDKYK